MNDALEAARTLGTEHGTSAADWAFDGNTSRETYVWAIAGFDAGDPAVYDAFSEPTFSNLEYSARQLCDDVDVDYDLSETRDVDQIADAYLDEARAAYWAEVERMARAQL